MLRTTRTLALLGVASFAIGVGAGHGARAQVGGGPAEVPPASYAANEYVDSQGCVFIRAGIGGTVTWVPRVSRDRQAVCGQAPSLKPAAQTTTATTTAADAQTQPRRRPAEVAPVATAPAPAPVLRTRTVPKPARSRARVPARSYQSAQAVPSPDPHRIDLPPGPPKGYRNVFTDGRLNPHRAKGTAAGREQMRRIWTDDVPARLVTEQPATTKRAPRPSARTRHDQTTVTVHVSSKAARRASSDGHRYVQVGAFANPSNVRVVISRLQRAGLPVSTTTTKGRKVILAGPFTTPAHTTRALAVARRVGFADAFTR